MSNAKEFCRAADPVVTAAHAYVREYAAEWPHPARERMLFVAERDAHEGRLLGYFRSSRPTCASSAPTVTARHVPAIHASARCSPSDRSAPTWNRRRAGPPYRAPGRSPAAGQAVFGRRRSTRSATRRG